MSTSQRMPPTRREWNEDRCCTNCDAHSRPFLLEFVMGPLCLCAAWGEQFLDLLETFLLSVKETVLALLRRWRCWVFVAITQHHVIKKAMWMVCFQTRRKLAPMTALTLGVAWAMLI